MTRLIIYSAGLLTIGAGIGFYTAIQIARSSFEKTVDSSYKDK